ncbi:MAG: SgcJ/EcaC family oxidoreductase [Parcubacteria group bacterium]|jgi:uncharacterized protein (TIGR02246 family)
METNKQTKTQTNTNEEGEKKEMTIEEIAKKNFVLWNEALLTKDPKKVAELYSADNTFLPTLAPEFKHGKEEAEGYFHHFLEKNPEGKIIEETVQQLSSNAYLHSGMYNFEVGPENDRKIVEARFTYAWQKDASGEWKIIHHHSSVRPSA